MGQTTSPAAATPTLEPTTIHRQDVRPTASPNRTSGSHTYDTPRRRNEDDLLTSPISPARSAICSRLPGHFFIKPDRGARTLLPLLSPPPLAPPLPVPALLSEAVAPERRLPPPPLVPLELPAPDAAAPPAAVFEGRPSAFHRTAFRWMLSRRLRKISGVPPPAAAEAPADGLAPTMADG